eukprot:TRINITY_DN18502_c2_g1_i2.p2 TRINITY_DN18502_c2_g1~~TRINITY_DN18502_c2_g1_i2.p2  ORF type:complete len:127 (-),score=9.04 TRINITY_DN18502_c2_g1_i2:21-401(-)
MSGYFYFIRGGLFYYQKQQKQKQLLLFGGQINRYQFEFLFVFYLIILIIKLIVINDSSIKGGRKNKNYKVAGIVQNLGQLAKHQQQLSYQKVSSCVCDFYHIQSALSIQRQALDDGIFGESQEEWD